MEAIPRWQYNTKKAEKMNTLTLPKRLTGIYDLRRYYDLRAQQVSIEAKKKASEERKEFCGICFIGTTIVVFVSALISALIVQVL
jgi:hypothetical protein